MEMVILLLYWMIVNYFWGKSKKNNSDKDRINMFLNLRQDYRINRFYIL